MSKHDVLVIGAGLSGLAAGIRLSQVGLNVVVCERQRVSGGLNSYYQRGGRTYDTGLHALTNVSRPGVRSAPLNVLLRQLRLHREELEICEQRQSSVRFPGVSLTFDNDPQHWLEQVAGKFPREGDAFRQLHDELCAYDPFFNDRRFISAKDFLEQRLRDPLLRDMVCCPVMYYGNPRQDDMDLRQFCIIYRSIFVEGMGRPAGGMRSVIGLLEKRLSAAGGELRLGCGIDAIRHDGRQVTELVDQQGQSLQARFYLSCVGGPETGRLLETPLTGLSDLPPGELAYLEMLFDLDADPESLGLTDGIAFHQLKTDFNYHSPDSEISDQGFVLCIPGNFTGISSPELRMTALASPQLWATADAQAYARGKSRCRNRALQWLEARYPGVTDHLIPRDMYTPRTFTRYTGRLNGAIYGMPDKLWDGRTPLDNLWLCGADQGYLGIVGAMLSGVTMANLKMRELVNR